MDVYKHLHSEDEETPPGIIIMVAMVTLSGINITVAMVALPGTNTCN